MPSSSDPVRIALVGLGNHGRTLQGAAEAAPNLDVVAVYDPDPAEAARAAERFGCPAVDAYEALLERDGLEAVSLCSPNFVHRAQAEAAFDAGLDVFVEKPIANTVADGLAMVEAAETAGRTLVVGHNMRFGAAVRWGHDLIVQGRLGQVVSVEVHFSSDTGLRLDASSWRLRPDQCPLLPMMQLGIHGVDLVHYLAGMVTEVSARARAVTTSGGVVDSVVAAYALDGGAHGTMVSNYCSPVHFGYRVAGTEGALWGTPTTLTFEPRAGGAPEVHDASADGFASYTAQMVAFGEAVRGQRPAELHGRVGLQALAVIEAMAESAAAGRPVAVPSFATPTAVHHAE